MYIYISTLLYIYIYIIIVLTFCNFYYALGSRCFACVCIGKGRTEIMAESGDHVSDSTGMEPDEDPELERLRAEEDEVARRVSAEVSEELSSHIAKLEQELKLAFDERMSALHQQCSTQAAEDISTRQVYQCVFKNRMDRMSRNPGNPGDLLEFKNPPGNPVSLLKFIWSSLKFLCIMWMIDCIGFQS